jgi:type III pantothenate kinase
LIIPGHGIMLRALEGGTAGLHVPTGEVRLFPKNTSDALTSGGTYAIAVRWSACTSICPSTAGGACLHHGRGRRLEDGSQHDAPFELLDNLIFDGLLVMAQRRWG